MFAARVPGDVINTAGQPGVSIAPNARYFVWIPVRKPIAVLGASPNNGLFAFEWGADSQAVELTIRV